MSSFHFSFLIHFNFSPSTSPSLSCPVTPLGYFLFLLYAFLLFSNALSVTLSLPFYDEEDIELFVRNYLSPLPVDYTGAVAPSA